MSSVTRRSMLFASAAIIGRAQKLTPAVTAVDHLLFGVSDLDHGIQWVQQRTGMKAVPGGSHPGVGTRNALLSLGAGHYLEIIAPDPAQSSYKYPTDLRSIIEPRLITFAIKTTQIEDAASKLRRAGYQVTGPAAGSRNLPSGQTLQWRTLHVLNTLASGAIEPVPFLIQWAPGTPHPSTTAPAGCRLEALELQHPNPSELSGLLRAMGIDAKISQASAARIVAMLQTPNGRVELS